MTETLEELLKKREQLRTELRELTKKIQKLRPKKPRDKSKPVKKREKKNKDYVTRQVGGEDVKFKRLGLRKGVFERYDKGKSGTKYYYDTNIHKKIREEDAYEYEAEFEGAKAMTAKARDINK